MFNDKDHEIFLGIQKEGAELRKRKNTDYGDSYKKMGPFGVVCRMSDKMERLITLHKQGALVDELMEDTALDLMNYTAMYILLKREEKGVKK